MKTWVDDKLAIMTARDNLSSIRFAWGVTEANAGGSSFLKICGQLSLGQMTTFAG